MAVGSKKILLVANIVLIVLLTMLAYNYSILYNENLNLKSELMDVESKLSILQKQLDYYKYIAGYQMPNYTGGNLSSTILKPLSFHAVAVKSGNKGYEGVVLNITISIVPGEGRILVNTIPRIGIDLQTSIEVARIVAINYTGVDLSHFDIILSVAAEEEVDVVDGPSAGGVITAILISLLMNRTLNSSIFMTGTINPDGSIGPVGGILEKAMAAAQSGGKVFLLPKGESVVTVYVEERTEIVPGFVIIRYKPVKVRVEDYLRERGYEIDVYEIGTIQDALRILWPGNSTIAGP
jgi:uncharacterized protein